MSNKIIHPSVVDFVKNRMISFGWPKTLKNADKKKLDDDIKLMMSDPKTHNEHKKPLPMWF